MTTQMMTPDRRQEIEQLLDSLPEDSLVEVLNFLQYLTFKSKQAASGPYEPVDTFEGIWEDHSITEEDITSARKELWGSFVNVY